MVEAKNSVLMYGHRYGQTEPVVQPAIFLGSNRPEGGRFCSLRNGKRVEEGGDEPRVATEESHRQGQGAGRLFVA